MGMKSLFEISCKDNLFDGILFEKNELLVHMSDCSDHSIDRISQIEALRGREGITLWCRELVKKQHDDGKAAGNFFLNRNFGLILTHSGCDCPCGKSDGEGIFEELKYGVSEMLSKLPNYCTIHSEQCEFEIPGAPLWNEIKPVFEKALRKSTGVKWVFWNKPKPPPRVCTDLPPSAICAQIEASLIISERPAAEKAAKEVEGVSSLMAELEAVDDVVPARPVAPKQTTVHAKLKEFNLASVTNIKCSAGIASRKKKLEPCHSAGEQEFLELAKSKTINIVEDAEDLSMKDIGRTKSTSAIEEIILTGPEMRYSRNSVETSMIGAMEKMKASRAEDYRPQRYKQCGSAGNKAHGKGSSKLKSPDRMVIDLTPDGNPLGSWVVL